MPVGAPHVIRAGTTGELFLVFAGDPSNPGAGRTGLGVEGASAGYVRDDGAGPVRVPLAPGTLGVHRPGSLAEVDPELMPGAYQLGVPDAMLAPGATQAVLVLSLPGAVVEPVEVELVMYDPFDAHAIGMVQQADWRRHEFLRTALSRLAAMELELQERAAGRAAGGVG